MEWPRTALYSRCQAKLNLNVEKKKRCSWRSAGHRCTWDEYCVGYAFALPREEKKERGDKAYRRAGYNDLAKGVQGKTATGVPLAGSSARTCNGGSFSSGRISPIWTRPSGPISCNILSTSLWRHFGDKKRRQRRFQACPCLLSPDVDEIGNIHHSWRGNKNKENETKQTRLFNFSNEARTFMQRPYVT